MRHVVITGATGLVGRALATHLAGEGHHVIALVRNPEDARRILDPRVAAISWNFPEPFPKEQALADCDTAIHLAGENIAKGRWTVERKRQLFASRVDVARNLIHGLLSFPECRLRTLISASAVGYFGDRGQEVLEDQSPPGKGFLADLCQAWESVVPATLPSGRRAVSLRFGIILSNNGGALPRLCLPIRLGLGGFFGDGAAAMPWIHELDVRRVILAAMDQGSWFGSFNTVAPEIVSNRQFMLTLAKTLHRPCWTSVPKFVLPTILGEAAEALLSSQRVIPKRLLEAGFAFRFPTLDSALADLIQGTTKR